MTKSRDPRIEPWGTPVLHPILGEQGCSTKERERKEKTLSVNTKTIHKGETIIFRFNRKKQKRGLTHK